MPMQLDALEAERRDAETELEKSAEQPPQPALVSGVGLQGDWQFVKFGLAYNYFIDTIKYAHMGRNQAQAQYQEPRA